MEQYINYTTGKRSVVINDRIMSSYIYGNPLNIQHQEETLD